MILTFYYRCLCTFPCMHLYTNTTFSRSLSTAYSAERPRLHQQTNVARQKQAV